MVTGLDGTEYCEESLELDSKDWEALKAGLVDELGYLDTALDRAKQSAELTEARVVTYHRPGTYTNNIYSGLRDSSTLRRIADWSQLPVGMPQFLYLWGAS